MKCQIATALGIIALASSISKAANNIGIENIAPFLPENPIIVEAGAHVGYDTRVMATYWPKGTIHAIEPLPSLFKQLKQNTFHLPNVYTYELALSTKNGNATLHISEGESDGSSSLLKPKDHLNQYPGVTFKKKITVKAMTLDKWASSHNIDHIDLLWLDMQGFEPAVLRASPHILKTVKAIVTEVNYTEMYKGCELYPSFKKWLESLGFKVIKEHQEGKTWGDVLFARAR